MFVALLVKSRHDGNGAALPQADVQGCPAMLDRLQRENVPCAADCFASVFILSAMFDRLQREDVVRTCEKWVRDVGAHDSARAKRMSGCLEKIQKLLAVL